MVADGVAVPMVTVWVELYVPGAGVKVGVAAGTVMVAIPWMLPLAAMIFALPAAMAVAVPAELAVATAALLDDQTAVAVRSLVLESL